MFNAPKYSLVTLSALSLTLGSQALAWSPLQYDSDRTGSVQRSGSVYDEIFNRLTQESQKDKPDGQSSEDPSTLKEDEAQAAIEKDATSESLNQRKTEDDAEPAVEVKPKRAAKPPGKFPSETVTDPQYFRQKARAYVAAGDYQSALNYVNRALELHPDYYDAWFAKALIYQLTGYDAAAARRYLALLQRRPDMIQARIALGILYRKHGDLQLAENEYKAAIEQNWNSFAAHYNLANLYMDQKKAEQALKEYKFCLKLQPNDAQVHNNIGVIFQHRHYLDEALSEFTKASHLDPANKSFYQNLEAVKLKISQRPGGTLTQKPVLKPVAGKYKYRSM